MMAGQYQDSDVMFGVMYDDGEAQRSGPKDLELIQDARGRVNAQPLQACGGSIQHQIRTLELQQSQQQQRTRQQRNLGHFMQPEEDCGDDCCDDDDGNDDIDDMDDYGGDDGGVGLDDGVDERDDVELQQQDTDARTGEASIHKWGSSDNSDGEGDGAIRFKLKKIAIENVSKRLHAMADARNPPSASFRSSGAGK